MKKKKAAGRPEPGVALAADVLASAAIFSGFDRRELDFLAEKSEFLDFEGSQIVFAAGDPGERLFIVASGSVVILSPEDGSALAEFVAGDSFGEMELLTGAKRNAMARAETAARLLAFPSGALSLRQALSDRPALSARILRSFLLLVAGRTRKSNALVKENSPWVRELRRQVYGDKLTGLLNRAYLEENLPKLLAGPQAAPRLALIMLKPDNFKEINDRFGHEVGDAALVLLAGAVDREVDKAGTAIRFMGNELAVLLPGATRDAALEAARGLQARLSGLDLSKLTGDPALRFSVSLGIALYPEHGADAEALVKASEGLPLIGRARGGSRILFPEEAE